MFIFHSRTDLAQTVVTQALVLYYFPVKISTETEQITSWPHTKFKWKH